MKAPRFPVFLLVLARDGPELRELEVFGAWCGNEDSSRGDAVARRGARDMGVWFELRKVSEGLVDIVALGLTCPVKLAV